MKRFIRRRLVVRRSYQCKVCRAKYSNRLKAQRCEAKPIEPQRFKVGDRVSSIEPRHCGSQTCRFVGTVSRVIGPDAPDEDYEIRWLGGERLGLHVFLYEVSYRCPCSGKTKQTLYYAPELKSVR